MNTWICVRTNIRALPLLCHRTICLLGKLTPGLSITLRYFCISMLASIYVYALVRSESDASRRRCSWSLGISRRDSAWFSDAASCELLREWKFASDLLFNIFHGNSRYGIIVGYIPMLLLLRYTSLRHRSMMHVLCILCRYILFAFFFHHLLTNNFN